MDLSHTSIRTLNLTLVENKTLGYVSFPEGITRFTGEGYANEACLYHMDLATLEALSQGCGANFCGSIRNLVIRNAETIGKTHCYHLETLVLSGHIREIVPYALKEHPCLKNVYLNGIEVEDLKAGRPSA